VLAIFTALAKDSPDRSPSKPINSYLKILKEQDIWRFNGFYMVTFGGFVGLCSFLPIFFFDEYGVSKIQAGSLAALCVFAGSFLRPLGGYLADHIGGIRVLSFIYGATGLLLFALATLPSLHLALLLLFATMACLGTGNGSVFQLVPQRFGQEIGVATGIIGAAGGLGGFFLPTLMGVLKSFAGTYSAGLLIFAAVSIWAMFVLIRVRDEWRADWRELEVVV
jgi:MFS transporter, NNP family, nitrate/nitrite transporter